MKTKTTKELAPTIYHRMSKSEARQNFVNGFTKSDDTDNGSNRQTQIETFVRIMDDVTERTYFTYDDVLFNAKRFNFDNFKNLRELFLIWSSAYERWNKLTVISNGAYGPENPVYVLVG